LTEKIVLVAENTGLIYTMLDYCWVANFVITMSSLYMLHDWYTGEPPLSPQAETSVTSFRQLLIL
jgi:hypothetical protein